MSLITDAREAATVLAETDRYTAHFLFACAIALDAKNAEIARLTAEGAELAKGRRDALAWAAEVGDRFDLLRAAVLVLCSSADKARMFVECFEPPTDGDFDSIATFKVDIPLDGYPRQWAVHAAPAALMDLDAALAAARKLVDGHAAHVVTGEPWECPHGCPCTARVTMYGLDCPECKPDADDAARAAARKLAEK